ncbi:hypothetical protein [Nocardia implantans]|uniref:DUF8020 domain-containing protein n=1 Tax=Nocardia implantans TaxID=3108168 RepID=A0ABU6AMB9_9NOCA|nr:MULTISPECIES: hypothetical protein [unclassified Nocardia]MBF6193439.1 hypothetical protein [Nocardia beijingensis]MEA3532648.1 hypothetical protein [Nocardia sp. CDC192]MEB3508540.1 hypothetical protein [Nocardia sp. CDC186]
MNLRRTTAAAAMVIGAMTIGLGTAHAEPAAATPDPIRYSVKLVEKTVVTTLKGGTFELAKSSEDVKEDDVYRIKDSEGNAVLTLPIAFKVADTVVPVKPVVKEDNTVLELTPEQGVNVNVPKDKPLNAVNVVAQPIASPIENQRAQNEFASQFGIATAVGGFLGTAIGVIGGAVIGCILGLPFLGVGCIPAAIAGAGIGGILGTVAIGGPALLVAGIDLVNTLQAPEGTTKWADKPK